MSTPVIILNSSPAKWLGVPLPADAKLILPRLALAWSMNSGSVLAGTDKFTSITCGWRMMLATGAMSRMKLKPSFS